MSTAWKHLSWVAAAAILGFGSAFVFADVLALPRGWFLAPHALLAVAFLGAYARWSGTRLILCTRRLALGLAATVVVGAMLAKNVLGQPASDGSRGVALVAELLWLGLVYGAVDALLLSVMPVVAAMRAGRLWGWHTRWPGRIATAALAIVASVTVTASYHLGFAEFRGRSVAKPVIGNTLMTVTQLATGSPIAAAGSHVVMHVAAVLHGPETTAQLPPHPVRAPR